MIKMLTVGLILGKLAGFINISWLLVFTPMIISIVLAILIILVALAAGFEVEGLLK